MVEVLKSLPTALDFCDTYAVAAGVVWVDPNGMGANFVCRMKLPADIVSNLVIWNNPTGGITNSDLKLVALVIQESCFTFVCLCPAWHTP